MNCTNLLLIIQQTLQLLQFARANIFDDHMHGSIVFSSKLCYNQTRPSLVGLKSVSASEDVIGDPSQSIARHTARITTMPRHKPEPTTAWLIII